MGWWPLRARAARKRDRIEEMRAHLDLYEEELVDRGRPRGEARRQARLAFGNPRVKLEELEAMDRLPLIETLGRDLRSAIRGLRAAPAFTGGVLAVLTLAMGVTTAVFSVVDAVVLRGLPFDAEEQLVTFGTSAASGEPISRPFAAPDFLALRTRGELFDGVAAISKGIVALRRDGDNEAETLRSQRVSAEFFAVLRVMPSIGRTFTAEQEEAGRDRVAVISYGLWQRRFGGTPDVLGKRLRGEAGEIEVLGVMPRTFSYPVGSLEPTEVWMPYVVPDRERVARISAYLQLIARRKTGTTLEGTQAALNAIVASSKALDSSADAWGTVRVRGLRESVTGYARSWMLLLLAAAGCVLLIACVNVANLLLVRATVRVRELRVRSALGATRWDLCRMLLVESFVLSTAGTGMGFLLAWLSMASLRALLPPDLPRVADIGLDWRVMCVAAAAALVTGLAFGLTPMFQWSRAIQAGLKENGRAETASASPQRLRATLLTVQVGLAVVLLLGATLFLTSFARLLRVDLGMNHRDVLLVRVATRATAAGPTEHATGLSRVLARVAEIPGVTAAALSTGNLPFSGSFSAQLFQGPVVKDPATQTIGFTQVSPSYFQTLKVPLRSGRVFGYEEGTSGQLVVILNETAARTYFPGQDPVGHIVSLKGSRTVVGVVADVRGSGPEGPVEREAFVPLTEGNDPTTGTLLVRATRDAAVVPRVKAAILSEFPKMMVSDPRTLEEGYGHYIARRRFLMFLLTGFGVSAVGIAAVGIYGVMAYIVTQRTREIGIRMALGARSLGILLSVLRRAATPIALGLVGGFGTAWLLASSVQRFLFHVEPHEIGLYAAVCAILIVAATLAAFVPARRAARVDPVIALRHE